MKLIKFITHRTKFCLLFLTTSVILGACSDDDNSSMGGNPVVSVGDIQPAYFGDSITVNVNCSDNVALSTLKATLKYSEEEVENVTLRTKENGNMMLSFTCHSTKMCLMATPLCILLYKTLNLPKQSKMLQYLYRVHIMII